MVKRLSISLEDDVHMGLEEMSEETGRNISDLVNELCVEALAQGRWTETVGAVAENAIKEGMTNAQALEAVRSRHPHAQTSLRSVAWYRSKLRKEDKSVPSDAQARAAK